MRVTSQALPEGSLHLRLHLDDTENYIAHTILKPLTEQGCELCGLNFNCVKHSYLKLAFKQCAKAGYRYCYIERRKNGKIVRTKFNLKKYA